MHLPPEKDVTGNSADPDVDCLAATTVLQLCLARLGHDGVDADVDALPMSWKECIPAVVIGTARPVGSDRAAAAADWLYCCLGCCCFIRSWVEAGCEMNVIVRTCHQI